VATAKTELRRDVLARLAALPPAVRAQEEEIVQAAVQAEPAWREARTVLVYRAVAPEMSVVGCTLAAWRSGKRVLFPRVADPLGDMTLHEVRAWSDLRPGTFGIPEPAASAPEAYPSEVDVALVPGVAFDASGGRLGRGRGFYDRLLPLVRGATFGVCFSCQLLPQVPRQPHDRPVTKVLAPALLGFT
jgi:5-formyltetrahydrofolate cyclo-ligase